jgi:hypothetical protein
MAVLTPSLPLQSLPLPKPAAPSASCPSCFIQRSGSLWQLGIEAQELTTAIGQLAEQLEADDDDTRAQALAELEAALLAEEGNKQALSAKADATCWVIEHLRGQAAYRQQQAKRLTALAAGDNGRADALEDSLVLVLTRLQPKATRFSFPNHELTSRKSSGRRDRRRGGPRSPVARRHHHHQARQGRHQRSPQSRPPHRRRPAPLPPQLAHPLTGPLSHGPVASRAHTATDHPSPEPWISPATPAPPPQQPHQPSAQGAHLVDPAVQLGGADHPQEQPPALAPAHLLQRAALLAVDRAPRHGSRAAKRTSRCAS